MQTNEGISQVIRYEQELKTKMQETQNVILEGRLDKQQLQFLRNLIGEEDVLMKYLEVQSSGLQPQVRKLYDRNMVRLKKKIKEHKQYVNSQFGQGAADRHNDPYNIKKEMKIQEQNMRFIDQKRVMYDNQMLQHQVGRDINRQGFYLQDNINKNKDIRQEADSASNNIKLIKNAILKRKLQFYSLFILLALALIFVFVKRIFFPTAALK